MNLLIKSLRSSLIAGAIVLLVSLFVPVSRTAAQQASLPGQFAYVIDGTKLFLVRGNVNEPSLLLEAESGTTLANPHFSKDGSSLAYCVDLASTNQQPALYILNTVTGEKVQVTPDGSCDYDWSPDGKTLIYSTPYYTDVPPSGEDGIWSYSRQTGEIKLLIPGQFRDPRWLPDGQTLSYFDTCFECIGQFYTYNLTTGAKKEWSQKDSDQFIGPDVDWSPDGNLLAYDRAIWVYASEGETYPLSVANNTGETRKDIYSQTGQGAFFPIWSPDGKSIGFASFESFTIGNYINRRADMMATSPDGSNTRILYSSIYEIHPQAWSPDSGYLLLVEPTSMANDPVQKQQLILVDVKTGSTLWKTPSSGTITADWAPLFVEQQAMQNGTATPGAETGTAAPTSVGATANPTNENAGTNSSIILLSMLIFSCALIGIVVLILYLWRWSINRRSLTQEKPTAPETPVAEEPPAVPEQETKPSSEEMKKTFQEGVDLVHAGKVEEGILALRQVIAAEPENEVAWFWLGIASARQKDYRSAERCFLQAKRHGHPEADKALDWLKTQKQ